MPASTSAAKKARRNDVEAVPAPQVAHALPHWTECGRPAATVGVSLGPPHLCPGYRRPRGLHARHCLDQREGSQAAKDRNGDEAKSVGQKIAERAIAKGVKQVVFDRGGYI